MNQILDNENNGTDFDNKIRIACDVFILLILGSLIYSISKYFMMFQVVDSWYIPKYAVDFVYKNYAVRNLELSVGLFIGYLPRLFRKYKFALAILVVTFILQFFVNSVYHLVFDIGN